MAFGFFGGRNKVEEEMGNGIVDVINEFREELSMSENDWWLSNLQYNKDNKIDVLQWRNSEGDTINIIREQNGNKETIAINIVKNDETVIEIGSFSKSLNETTEELLELAIKRAVMYMETNSDTKNLTITMEKEEN